VATQRPSVNVITGLIKANVPARIAFAVASSIDSRTILDSSGAEKLLGKGDLLFTTADLSKPRRIQGAFLSDEEIERVINFWQSQSDPDYLDDITEGQTRFTGPGFNGGLDGDDELLEEAKQVVIKAGKASASLLQRRLRVGYARAARLLDLLEERGVIGPGEGAKPREILVSDSELLGIPTETTEAYEDEEEAEEELKEEDETENEEEVNEEETEEGGPEEETAGETEEEQDKV